MLDRWVKSTIWSLYATTAKTITFGVPLAITGAYIIKGRYKEALVFGIISLAAGFDIFATYKSNSYKEH